MLYQGSDGQVHVLGDGEELKHWKYIKKIKTGSGWRYFYSPEELRQFYNEGKKKVDSIPRLQKHGNKYYIADKKTQSKIDKSGVGGNYYDKYGHATEKRRYKSSANKFNDFSKFNEYQLKNERAINTVNKAIGRSSTRTIKDEKGRILYTQKDPTSKTIAKTSMEYAINKAKSEAAKSAAKGVTKKYERYEAKNVINRKLSDVKKKLKKKNKGKKKVGKITITNERITPINEVTLKDGTTIKYKVKK